MSESIGHKDIHGDFIHDGDYVHCWSGSLDQRHVDQSLRGQVHKGSENWCVAGNELALGCAQYVEIINQGDSK